MKRIGHFFNYKNQFYFSYGLTPEHLVYFLFLTDEDAKCYPEKPYRDINKYYGNYELYVNDSKKRVFISVSTPAIQSLENSNRYWRRSCKKYK